MRQGRCQTCGKYAQAEDMYYNEDNDRAECVICTFG